MPSASFSSRERRGIVILLAIMGIVLVLGLLPSTFLATETEVDPRPLYQHILEEQDKLSCPDTTLYSRPRHEKHSDNKNSSGSKSRKKPRSRKAAPDGKKAPHPRHDPFAPVPASQP